MGKIRSAGIFDDRAGRDESRGSAGAGMSVLFPTVRQEETFKRIEEGWPLRPHLTLCQALPCYDPPKLVGKPAQVRSSTKRASGRVLMEWKRAYAIKKGTGESPLQYATVREEFLRAAVELKQEIGRVDPKLRYGELGATEAVETLLEAIGPARTNAYVHSERVQEIAARGMGDEGRRGVENAWAMRSANAFLETCVRHHLGIRFSS